MDRGESTYCLNPAALCVPSAQVFCCPCVALVTGLQPVSAATSPLNGSLILLLRHLLKGDSNCDNLAQTLVINPGSVPMKFLWWVTVSMLLSNVLNASIFTLLVF